MISSSCSKIPYSKILSGAKFLHQITEKLSTGVKTSAVASSFSLKGLVLSWIYNDACPQMLVVCSNNIEARALKDDIETFCMFLQKDTSSIHYFPPRPVGLQNRLFNDSLEGASRIACLDILRNSSKPFIITTSLQCISQKTLPGNIFDNSTIKIQSGQHQDFEGLITHLIDCGYSREGIVENTGQFASRGGIIDVFPPKSPMPLRLEFLGDRVDTIRYFDPNSQLSSKMPPPGEISVLPAREIILSNENINRARSEIRTIGEKIGTQKRKLTELYGAIDNRNYFDIPPSLLPAFYPETWSIFNYINPGTLIAQINSHAARTISRDIEKEAYANYELLLKKEEPVYSPQRLFADSAETCKTLMERSRLCLDDISLLDNDCIEIDSNETASRLKQEEPKRPLDFLFNMIKGNKGEGINTCLFYEHFSSCEKLVKLLIEQDLPFFMDRSGFEIDEKTARSVEDAQIFLLKGKIEKSFEIPGAKVSFLDETSLFARKRFAKEPGQISKSVLSLSELKSGDYVVHTDHGIARYEGLKHLSIRDIKGDFLSLIFAGEDRLYLPIYRMNLVSKYIGSDAKKPRLSSLGSQTWEKAKSKATKAISQMAADLIKLYAERKVVGGFAFSKPDENYYNFESLFPYEETADQKKAIEDVGRDMEKPSPMDRLICGDVGFGKTEVALRASYRAVMDGKQVAILVPTTVLAQQHYENFKNRFKNYPVSVDFLSRFKSRTSQIKCLRDISSGRTDIIIGTHRMLSADVEFKDLGLLIIDEEHRFGVKHKEKIKKYRSMLDVLALSATPIPRSLEMSLVGLRDLSLINSPPADRKAIRTFISKYDDSVIIEAVEREMKRGGKVFFVHNRIETIDAIHAQLKKILPGARIVVAHGRMKESKLEGVMLDFLSGKYDILLSTAIIESGLDIPSANTIIVNRADLLGLAQLYQLRGRVGRAKELAYAYLLLPASGAFKPEAIKRLKILKNFAELGSGIKIALHDLEIRGAGNIFGESQSGHISAVGLELYTKILERTIKKIKKSEDADDFQTELNVNVEAFIQDSYIPDVGLRLSYYKRLAVAASQSEVESISGELSDRFGTIPERLKMLLEIASLKIMATKLLIKELYIDKNSIFFKLADSRHALTDAIVGALKNEDLKYTRDGKIRFDLTAPSPLGRIEQAKKMLQALAQYVT